MNDNTMKRNIRSLEFFRELLGGVKQCRKDFELALEWLVEHDRYHDRYIEMTRKYNLSNLS